MPAQHPPLPSADQLFDEFPTGLLVLAVDGTILKVNRTFCAWLGVAPQDLVGLRRLQELFTVGGRIFHQTHWLPTLEMQGSLSEVKLDMRHRDGRTVPMMLNTVRRTHGEHVFDEVSVAMAKERNQYERELLAARKRADELLERGREAQDALNVTQVRLRQALRLGDLYLWEEDLGTGVRRYDDDVARLLGHVASRPISHAEFSARIHPEDVPLERAATAAALAGDEGYQCTFRLLQPGNAARTVVATGNVLLDEEGNKHRIVGVFSDVTEMSRQRELAEDRALFAEQMVGIVSHDLRTPLSAILLGTQFVARGAAPASQAKMLERVSASARRAQRLVEDLLDFTLVRVGRGLAVARLPVQLPALLAATVEELSLTMGGRAIDFAHEGEASCSADPDRIAQLVGNLVSNAATHGAPGTPITVRSAISADSVSIVVANQGTPIAPAMQARIFEPMVRGVPEGGTARSVGLGLYIVRAIAQAHGGHVQLRSADAETAFAFVFPRAAAPAQPGP